MGVPQARLGASDTDVASRCSGAPQTGRIGVDMQTMADEPHRPGQVMQSQERVEPMEEEDGVGGGMAHSHGGGIQRYGL